MTRQLESLITNKCIDYLKELKSKGYPLYWEHRSGTSGFSYKKGIPDLFIVIGNIHIECEMKTPFGHLSTMQEKYRKMFIDNGTPYVCPKSVKEFKEFINSFLPSC